MTCFDIDPDITKARTISTDLYLDPRYFELSKEKIFARSWHFLCHENEISGLFPKTLLPGVLDEPVIIAKDGGELRCLSNVCTHRGKILVEEPCDATLIRCGYHGRRFSLDGKFLSMPEFEGVADFPCESDNLKQLPLANWNGFLLASLDPVAELADVVGDVAAQLPFDRDKPMRLSSRREYNVNAHWALYCENYLEGFHIPYVHRGLNAVVDYGSYKTETFRYSSLQTGFDADGQVAARYLFIFPNLMFNFYDWGVSVNVVRPVAPDRTQVEFLSYVSDKSKLDQGAGADLDGVEMEDEAVVESVQRGIRSRFYSHGRYSPTREQGTHHFHRLIAEFIG
ncbi:MAG: Rieske (2Fe-2S) domain-containing protein [Acidobacteria bacterium OLB17]|nr:MAG: Rieske (2Fe-2S) domain-containing protein [Acidobacteria bacterium OLB17]MCZ2389873.1 aromatic ring-hydroxylating dioxygenase subunit alpha [Acidobacteriota bacterium]